MRRRIALRGPAPSDEPAFLAAVKRSRALHRPWVAPPATPEAFARYLAAMTQPSNIAFLVCRRDTHELVGVVNITQMVQGAFRSGYLGYYAFAGHERQGLMREALSAVVREAFGRLRLHRLEANIQPGNTASLALARACGFSREGYSPRYLKIGGRWRDHERWARVA
jgi:[ribosomal protein S5]-alanine N-acetyltransferase